jgi:hypothetical protein
MINDGVRVIQIQREKDATKYSAAHDDAHCKGELANAAAYYAATERTIFARGGEVWPWTFEQFTKHEPGLAGRLKDLATAGSLIAAEIDRLLRLQERESEVKL